MNGPGGKAMDFAIIQITLSLARAENKEEGKKDPK